MNAMPSGMIHDAVAPAATRASVSVVRLSASPQAATVSADSAHITAIVTYLPKRSPIGPMTSCIEPCINV